MAGRRPKPTAIKRQQGNPGKRKLNDREPQYPPGVRSCPRWLSPGARREFRRLARLLTTVGVLTQADREVLAAYSQAIEDFRQALRMEREHGAYIETENGWRRAPWVLSKREAMDAIRKFAIEMGLTPAARSKIEVPPPGDQADELGTLIGFPRAVQGK